MCNFHGIIFGMMASAIMVSWLQHYPIRAWSIFRRPGVSCITWTMSVICKSLFKLVKLGSLVHADMSGWHVLQDG
jgi:hypothetical protein